MGEVLLKVNRASLNSAIIFVSRHTSQLLASLWPQSSQNAAAAGADNTSRTNSHRSINLALPNKFAMLVFSEAFRKCPLNLDAVPCICGVRGGACDPASQWMTHGAQLRISLVYLQCHRPDSLLLPHAPAGSSLPLPPHHSAPAHALAMAAQTLCRCKRGWERCVVAGGRACSCCHPLGGSINYLVLLTTPLPAPVMLGLWPLAHTLHGPLRKQGHSIYWLADALQRAK